MCVHCFTHSRFGTLTVVFTSISYPAASLLQVQTTHQAAGFCDAKWANQKHSYTLDRWFVVVVFLLLSMSSRSRLLQPARTHCWHRCSYHCSTGDKFLSNVAQSNRRRKEMTVSVTCSRHRYRHRPQPSGLVPLWLLSHDTLKNQGEGRGPFLVVAFRVRRLFSGALRAKAAQRDISQESFSRDGLPADDRCTICIG